MKKHIVSENLKSYRECYEDTVLPKKFYWKGNEDDDFGPTRVRTHYSRNRKGGPQLGNCNWLRRFLQSRVGHCWDDVYAEIVQSITRRKDRCAIDRLLHWWVEREVYITEDGVVHYYGRDYTFLDGFYVIQGIRFSGTLCYHARQYKPPKKPKKNLIIMVDKLHEYVCLNGFWYYRTYITTPYLLLNEYGKFRKIEDKRLISQTQLSRRKTEELLGLRVEKKRKQKRGRYLPHFIL